MVKLSSKNVKDMTEEEHKAYHRRLRYIILMIFILFFGGAIFYHSVEKWRYIDSFYFAATTMTTVGFGDVSPKTDIGKLFTIFYIFTSVGMVSYGLITIASHLVEMREEYMFEALGYIKLRHNSRTLWQKIKSFFVMNPEKITENGLNKPD